jgi:hypothetical protein
MPVGGGWSEGLIIRIAVREAKTSPAQVFGQRSPMMEAVQCTVYSCMDYPAYRGCYCTALTTNVRLYHRGR